MEEFIGLDVSLKDTAISIRRDGKRVWRGKCPSDPKLIAEVIRKHAPNVKRVIFETGPLSVWFFHSLSDEGLPAICIDARHAAKALDMAANKTDANDADGLAHIGEVGFYREVRVKSFDNMLVLTLISGRKQLMDISTTLSNQIRGLMKTFGLLVPKGGGGMFDTKVRDLVSCNDALARIILPLLDAWRGIRAQTAELDRLLIAAARKSPSCRQLTSIPGVGVITATSILTRVTSESSLRAWGLKLRERLGFKRAAVAVARKLAVIMHTMLKTGGLFDHTAGAAA